MAEDADAAGIGVVPGERRDGDPLHQPIAQNAPAFPLRNLIRPLAKDPLGSARMKDLDDASDMAVLESARSMQSSQVLLQEWVEIYVKQELASFQAQMQEWAMAKFEEKGAATGTSRGNGGEYDGMTPDASCGQGICFEEQKEEDPGDSADVSEEVNPRTTPRTTTILNLSEDEIAVRGGLSKLTMDPEEHIVLLPTIWDLSMLVFTKMVNRDSSWLILFINMLNIFMQWMLCILISDHFAKAQNTRSTVEELWFWRITVAHDIKFMDIVTQQSLARKVCAGTSGLFMSSTPAALKSMIDDYRPDDNSEQEGQFMPAILHWKWQGVLMCTLCIMIWWFTVLRECRQIWNVFSAVWLLPAATRDMSPQLMEIDYHEGQFVINYVSLPRRLWCLHVVWCRVLVTVFLCFVGTIFLLYTIELDELILNCAALEIVINLDELIFESLAPTCGHKAIAMLSPIPKARVRYVRGIEIYAVLIFAGTTLLGVLATFFIIEGTDSEYLDCSRQAVCGGQLDFLIAMDPGGAVTATSSFTDPEDDGIWPLQDKCMKYANDDSYRFRAVEELIRSCANCEDDKLEANVESSLSDSAAGVDWAYFSLAKRPGIPTGERMADLNPLCKDFEKGAELNTLWPAPILRDIVGDAVGAQSVDTFVCSQAEELCGADSEAGVRMRQWCSDTCGCNDPASPNVLTNYDAGCPTSCDQTVEFKSVLNSVTTCQDHSPSSAVFKAYVKGIQRQQASYSKNQDWQGLLQMWIDNLQDKGCDAHPLIPKQELGDLCTANAFKLKPLSFVCPRSCGCHLSPGQQGHFPPPPGQQNTCPTVCTTRR